jgi:glycine cleavage system H protein
MMKIPTELRYTESDEWVRLEGKVATVGVTDYAQDQLSDLVFFEITAAVGESVETGQSIGAIESVKAAADLYSPLTGTLKEINAALTSAPELVNSDPYGAGWMAKIEVSDAGEIEALMDSAAYEKHCQERSH